jgi:hypothetical protein
MSRVDLQRGSDDRDDGARQAKSTYFWRTDEIARLEALCRGRADKSTLEKEIPGKSLGGMKRKAKQLELPWEGVQDASRAPDADRDMAIRLAFASGSDEDVETLAEELGKEPWWIAKRARRLGVQSVRLQEDDWCPLEMKILREWGPQGAAMVHIQLTKEGYERTPSAVASKLGREGIKKFDPDTFSARAVSLKLGVDEKTVVRWITTAGLKATQSTSGWRLDRRDIRRWMAKNARRINVTRVTDSQWLIEILSGG